MSTVFADPYWSDGMLKEQTLKDIAAIIDEVPMCPPLDRRYNFIGARRIHNLYISAVLRRWLDARHTVARLQPHIFVEYAGGKPYLKNLFRDSRNKPFIRLFDKDGGEFDVMLVLPA